MPVQEEVWVVYGDASDDLWKTTSVNGAAWSTDVEVLDGATVDLVSASVFIHNSGNGG